MVKGCWGRVGGGKSEKVERELRTLVPLSSGRRKNARERKKGNRK